MKITRTYQWNRRDFTFDSKCEVCGQLVMGNNGYDDDNFLNTVLPDRKCPNCDQSTNSHPTDGFRYKLIPRHDPAAIL